jgi:enterochelin esterase family protein
LKRLVQGGNRGAVDRFWQELKTAGTPLVEPVPGDKGHVLLTFVYRGGESVKGVVLTSGLAGRGNEAERALLRLPDTDVWYTTYWIRSDLRFSYGFVPNGDPAADHRNSRVRDPLNPKRCEPFVDLGGSVVELPEASAQPWTAPGPAAPAGRLDRVQVSSKALNQRRSAEVYTPAGYDDKGPDRYPLLICFDGPVYSSPKFAAAPTTLDTLVARRRIPPLVAVFVTQSANRNRELSNDRAFLDFVADELLPEVRRRWRVTADPARTVVCGSSAGGLAAAFAAYSRPDVFGNVLSQSGAFWLGKGRDDPGREWLTGRFEASAKLPVRFVLQVGIMERHPTPQNGPSILRTNRHLRDVLTARGYEVHYREIAGGHEPLSWCGGVADGLIQLLGTEAPATGR